MYKQLMLGLNYFLVIDFWMQGKLSKFISYNLDMNDLLYYVNFIIKVGILVLIFSIIKIILNVIKKRILRFYEKTEIYKKRITLVKLFFSISDYVLIFLFIWYLLKIFNIDTTPLLAVGGVAGVAIGFAGQTFFRDAIAGIFLIFENYYSVGDTIEIDDMLGTVEEIGIRTTILRNYEGKLFYIPNGDIRKVIKYGYGDQSVYVEVPISYESDIDKAKMVIEKVGENLLKENELIDNVNILGVDKLETSGMKILVKLRVDKDKRWSARRKFLEEIKKAFDKEGIEIPYSKMVVFLNDKDKN